jgi:predicted DNA-binding WGR domain protein
MSDIPVVGWYQEYVQGSSSKFYAVSVADNGLVVLTWGRIGAGGQHKFQKLPTRADAEIIGLRQVFAKQAKGYKMIHNEIPYQLSDRAIAGAVSAQDGTVFRQGLQDAANSPEFKNRKDAVFQQYDNFNSAAQVFMDRITSGNRTFTFDEMQAELAILKESWGEINTKHDTARINIELAEQMLGQALMNGSLT